MNGTCFSTTLAISCQKSKASSMKSNLAKAQPQIWFHHHLLISFGANPKEAGRATDFGNICGTESSRLHKTNITDGHKMWICFLLIQRRLTFMINQKCLVSSKVEHTGHCRDHWKTLLKNGLLDWGTSQFWQHAFLTKSISHERHMGNCRLFSCWPWPMSMPLLTSFH